MTADITINDGTTSRTYKTSLGGVSRLKPNVVEHVRKTAEFDDTPEYLTARFTRDGKTNVTRTELAKTKLNTVTGKLTVMKTIVTHIVEPGVFTQTESDNQLKEFGVFLGTSGVATDISQGNI